jgi:hypothetical protein
MKDNNTGKNKNFYSRGKEIFDGIEPLYKNSKRITKNELHNMQTFKNRPGKQPVKRETVVQTEATHSRSGGDPHSTGGGGASDNSLAYSD